MYQKTFFAFIGIILLSLNQLQAQSHSLEVTIINQPDNHIILGDVKGDNFTPIDSAKAVNKTVKFTIPEGTHPGVYRLILGQTTYAKVMNEAPQQLDFIYNNENIILETYFDKPEEKLQVILSDENRVWYEFKRKEILIQNELSTQEKEIDYYREKQNKGKLSAAIEIYNRLQKSRDQYILEIADKNAGLLVSKMIMEFREPFIDGTLSADERKAVLKEKYLGTRDFTDETLIYSQIYTDIIFSYLISYNQKNYTPLHRENEYKKAVDIILAATNTNPKVYEFILDYLVHGFEVLKMEGMIDYIADKYSGTTCQTDEKTTLERKLLTQKMKPGTEVPDFTMNDINGDPVTLSQVQKEKTLVLFWASWCPHCDEMIPFIKNWLKLQSQSFEVVAISLDTSEKDWKDAVAKHKMESWYNLSDLKEWDGKVAEDYNVYATPTLFIIDKNRKIIATPITVNDLSILKY